MTTQAKKAKERDEQLRGQMMLQIAAGRFFRPDVPINEYLHRRTVYSNCPLPDPAPVQLPVGTLTGSTGARGISTAMIEAIDRLEALDMNGRGEFMVSTGGSELIDDIAYVMTFALNRTFSRNHDQVHRLVSNDGALGRRRSAAGLFPALFDPGRGVLPGDLERLKEFMGDLLALDRYDFARVMRVIRNTVDATRRALDDPTGAYTDFVAALESLGDQALTTPVTWDRYDGRKRKIIDSALEGQDPLLQEKVHAAILEADQVGATRLFVSSTLARISPAYYREEAVGTLRPPRSADLERMLGVAYQIRSKKGHVLQDLGDEAWAFTDGAETVYEPGYQRILTLAGLWRLVRHVIRRYVVDAPKTKPAAWDYRNALPGMFRARLAPRYWLGHPQDFSAKTATLWFNGAAEVLIAAHAGETAEEINLIQIVEKVEALVPREPEGDSKTAMVAIYFLCQDAVQPELYRPGAEKFLRTHIATLDRPSPIAFAVGLLSDRESVEWTVDQWIELATARRAARMKGKELPLPEKIDALLQLETADRLEAVGRHNEAVRFAANAVEECPGSDELMAWEGRLAAGDHDAGFNGRSFLFGTEMSADDGGQEPTGRSDKTKAAATTAEDSQGMGGAVARLAETAIWRRGRWLWRRMTSRKRHQH